MPNTKPSSGPSPGRSTTRDLAEAVVSLVQDIPVDEAVALLDQMFKRLQRGSTGVVMELALIEGFMDHRCREPGHKGGTA